MVDCAASATALAQRVHEETLRHGTRGHDVKRATRAIDRLTVSAYRQHAPSGSDKRFAPVPCRGSEAKRDTDFSIYTGKRKLCRDLTHEQIEDGQRRCDVAIGAQL